MNEEYFIDVLCISQIIMRVTIVSGFIVELTLFTLFLGAQALPQWLNGLRRDLEYAPAAYNPVYGPRDGVAGYTYGGYGPQPTVITTSNSAPSKSETSGMSSQVRI
jgi:hypothetical protein